MVTIKHCPETAASSNKHLLPHRDAEGREPGQLRRGPGSASLTGGLTLSSAESPGVPPGRRQGFGSWPGPVRRATPGTAPGGAPRRSRETAATVGAAVAAGCHLGCNSIPLLPLWPLSWSHRATWATWEGGEQGTAERPASPPVPRIARGGNAAPPASPPRCPC